MFLLGKKQIITLSLSILFSLSAFADCYQSYHLVSDFDDTIKTYRSKETRDVVRNALTKFDINAGFKTLYRMMISESTNGDCIDELIYNNQLYTVLTASPKLIKHFVQKFFVKNQMNQPHLILKGLGDSSKTYKLKKLIERRYQKLAPFILVGDDTSLDPKAYADFKEAYPQHVKEIYIHNLYNKKPYKDQFSYTTAFEIALNEYANDRLSEKAVLMVGREVLKAKKKDIIPPYGYCPLKPILHNSSNSDKINQMAQKISQLIFEMCKQRDNLIRAWGKDILDYFDV